ncbi:MAG: hypothetical protein WEA76_08605 [Acidimicrobiia bacterium]
MDDRVALAVTPVAEVADDRVRIVLEVDVPAGVHIEPHRPDDPFLIPTVVTVNGLDDVEVTYPDPVAKHLGWNDVALMVLEGPLEFVVTGQRRPDGEVVSGGISYQPCLGGACLPTRTVTWSTQLSPAKVGT